MSNISRRQFFGSTAAVAAVGLTGAAHAADLCSIPKKWDHTVDVIIVGAGGAGLAAAITALEKGAKVAILEKLGMDGETGLILILLLLLINEGADRTVILALVYILVA